MLYYLYHLTPYFVGFNVFRYETFRAMAAALTFVGHVLYGRAEQTVARAAGLDDVIGNAKGDVRRNREANAAPLLRWLVRDITELKRAEADRNDLLRRDEQDGVVATMAEFFRDGQSRKEMAARTSASNSNFHRHWLGLYIRTLYVFGVNAGAGWVW